MRCLKREACVLEAFLVVPKPSAVVVTEADSCPWAQNGHIGVRLAITWESEWTGFTKDNPIHFNMLGQSYKRREIGSLQPTPLTTPPLCRFGCQNSDLWSPSRGFSVLGHRTGTFEGILLYKMGSVKSQECL
jgi:hypothetical protein